LDCRDLDFKPLGYVLDFEINATLSQFQSAVMFLYAGAVGAYITTSNYDSCDHGKLTDSLQFASDYLSRIPLSV